MPTLASAPSARDPAPVAPAAPAADELDALVARLESNDWREREDATEAIVSLAPVNTNDRIRERLARDDLSTEQRHRLLDALCRRIVERPRGAIGITMDSMRRDGRGVRVVDLVRGMPAAEVLRVGDVIEHINDEPIRNSEELATVVQEMKPGTSVRLRVQRPVRDAQGRPRRDGAGETITEPVELTIQLGSMEQLEQGERFAGNPVRVQTMVLREREMEAARLRNRFAAPGSLVQVDGAAAAPRFTNFAALLERVEDAIDRAESEDQPATVAQLEEVLRGIETLRGRLGDPSVTERDRERLAISMRRASLLLSRSIDAQP